MSMDPYNVDFADLLKECVNDGTVPMSRIDDAVRRILRFKMRVGLFDNPTWNVKKYKDFGSKKHAAVALEAAEQSLVLLKIPIISFRFRKDRRFLSPVPTPTVCVRSMEDGAIHGKA